MKIKQLSVFLENRKGRLSEVLGILAKNHINIVATSLADTSDYGMLRMIVSEPIKACNVLREDGMQAMITEVIGIRVPHATGSLYKGMDVLLENDVNVEYMYAFANGEDASAILKTKDIDKAIEVLHNAGFEVWKEEDAYHANIAQE